MGETIKRVQKAVRPNRCTDRMLRPKPATPRKPFPNPFLHKKYPSPPLLGATLPLCWGWQGVAGRKSVSLREMNRGPQTPHAMQWRIGDGVDTRKGRKGCQCPFPCWGVSGAGGGIHIHIPLASVTSLVSVPGFSFLSCRVPPPAAPAGSGGPGEKGR